MLGVSKAKIFCALNNSLKQYNGLKEQVSKFYADDAYSYGVYLTQ